MANYFNITYTGKTEITIDEYLKQREDVYWEMTKDNFLYFKDDYDVTNIEKIYGAYSLTYQQKYLSDFQSGTLEIIVPNTEISIPKENTFIEQSLLIGDNQLRENKSQVAYFSENYLNLLLDDNNVRSKSLIMGGRGFDVQIINQSIRVWVWIRALDKIINISPFVSNLNTSKGTEGSFNIIIDPVHKLSEVLISGDTYINYFNIEGSDNQHVVDFFEKNLQMNDVIFIRFDELQSEVVKDRDKFSALNDFEINNSLLVDRNWDMIGLLDPTRISYSAGSTDKFLNLQGRDLMKLLTEDASYFLSVKFIQNSDKSWIWGGDNNDSWFKRNMISGSYDYYFSYALKDIKSSIGFVINQLSNLGITPDSLWKGYGEKRSRVNDIPTQDISNVKSKLVKGIWQIIKLYVEPEQNDRRIADDSLGNPDGTLFEYISKLCQSPFVEFYGDTNGDMFDLVVRQPPFSKEQIRYVLNTSTFIKVQAKDLLGYDLSFDDRYYTSYQIEPENTFLGEDAGVMLSYIPIIYFNEMAETFGNRRLVIKDNYISLGSLTGKDLNKNLDIFTQNLLPDLKYIIESNSYLPFTRKGTITINRDRTIKKGSFIHLGSTNELFYVTEVSHSASINRSKVDGQTTLTVERGMIIDFINEKLVRPNPVKEFGSRVEERSLVNFIKVSYFNVFDSEFIIKTIQSNMLPTTTENNGRVQVEKKNITTKFGVNKPVLEYFLSRNQFEKNQ